jgi:hypothetical protein
MIKKSLTVLALGAIVAFGACSKTDDGENLGADTTATTATVPPVVSDTGMAGMTPDTGIAVDTTVADTTAADSGAL